jgi:hypothetical protein
MPTEGSFEKGNKIKFQMKQIGRKSDGVKTFIKIFNYCKKTSFMSLYIFMLRKQLLEKSS